MSARLDGQFSLDKTVGHIFAIYVHRFILLVSKANVE